MKNFILIIALLFSTQVFAQPAAEAPNKLDAKGKKDGVWVEKYKNGKKKFEGTFNHGVPAGQFKHYDEKNGKLEAQLNYYPDGNKAAAFLYYANGVVMAQGLYNDKKKDSLWRYYAQDSVLVSQEFYRMGVKHGEWKLYYRNGINSSLETFNNGKKEGAVAEWFDSGKVKSEGTFKNGKQEGFYTTYFPNGVASTLGNYKNGLKNGEWIYNGYLGKQEKKEIYQNGILVYTSEPRISYWDTSETVIRSKEVFNLDYTSNYTHYYESTVLQREGKFLKDKRIGEWKFYNTEAEVDSTVNYAGGFREGTFKVFQSGKLVKEANYHIDKLQGVYKEYYLDDSLKLEGTYNKGKKTGVWKYFDKGLLLKEEVF
jgi:antitoxin component YwqK of YwqJK toxin-antitoxin module